MYPRGLRIAGATDPGCVRERNEDAVLWRAEAGIAVLADGMGGHNAGDVAATMAVDLLGGLLEGVVSQSGGDPGEVLLGALMAVQEVNAAIFERARHDVHLTGMGTTLVAAVVAQGWLTVLHVGDSRLYRLRDGHLEQLTADHSLVREMREEGGPAHGFGAAGRHIITRALGIAPEVEADVQQQPAEPGDLYLLCSDGLSEPVDAATLAAVAGDGAQTLEERVARLVDLARTRGGEDNISAILAQVPTPEPNGD